jgi:protein MpaA
MNLVDRSGGKVAPERRYARIVGLPLRKLPRYRGSATGWENHRFPASTGFVVELLAGRLSPKGVERFSDGIRTQASSLPVPATN